MSKKADFEHIESTDDAWDSGKLGRDEEFVGVADDDLEQAIDASLDLQQISIRLQKSLIDDFKLIARMHGIGYQPLMRQILTRFADSEKKRLLHQAIRERRRDEGDDDPPQVANG